jgi:hypothetical protein
MILINSVSWQNYFDLAKRNRLFWMKLLLLYLPFMDWITPIHVEKDAGVIMWPPCKEKTMMQWLNDRRGQWCYWKRDPTWPTTWPPCEHLARNMRDPQNASKMRDAREPNEFLPSHFLLLLYSFYPWYSASGFRSFEKCYMNDTVYWHHFSHQPIFALLWWPQLILS